MVETRQAAGVAAADARAPALDRAAGYSHAPSHAVGSPSIASPLMAVGGTAMPILELQRLAGNRAVAGALGLQRRPIGAETEYKPTDSDSMAGTDPAQGPDEPAKATPRKMTGYVGMNPDAKKEIKTLNAAAGESNVRVTTGDAALEAKLREEPEITNFVFDDLRISPAKVDRWGKAIDALVAASPSTRDVLGELMRWMNEAEDGDIILDRLVLSGHSNGFELWGASSRESGAQKPGVLVLERDLGNVAAAFPVAASQVRSIMFSACETVGAVDAVVRVFPNVESVWSYAGFSPSVAQGSGRHIQSWEAATEGGGAPTKRDAQGATAIWTRKDKWLVRDPGVGNVETLYIQAMSQHKIVVGPMLRGQKEIDLPELRQIYGRVQAVLRHEGLSAHRKDEVKEAMEANLRLRHWDSIRTHFASEHAPKLVEAYRAFGMSQPNWATITRGQLVRHIDELVKSYGNRKELDSAKDVIKRYVVDALYELKPKDIPADWNE